MSDAENSADQQTADSRSKWLALWECLSVNLERLRQHLNAAANQHELAPEAALVLYYLGDGPGNQFNQRQLAQSIRVSPAKMSGLLESLRQQDLVHARRDKQDRRNQTWSLTPVGRRLLQSLLHSLDAPPFSAEQLDQLLRTVPQLAKLLAEQQSISDCHPLSQREGRAA